MVGEKALTLPRSDGAGTQSSLTLRVPDFQALIQTGIYTIGSLSLRPSNYNTGFPGSAAGRWQVIVLGLHNHMSKAFIINLSLLVLFLWRMLANTPLPPNPDAI